MGEYTPQIKAIVNGLTGVTEKVVTRLSFNISANLIEDTPVDIGWARANWVPSVGTSVTHPAVHEAPSSALVAAQLARQASGQAKVLNYKLSQGMVFITNNVPYIGKLNDGSSKQAPRGFIQSDIRRGAIQTERDIK